MPRRAIIYYSDIVAARNIYTIDLLRASGGGQPREIRAWAEANGWWAPDWLPMYLHQCAKTYPFIATTSARQNSWRYYSFNRSLAYTKEQKKHGYTDKLHLSHPCKTEEEFNSMLEELGTYSPHTADEPSDTP